MDVASWRRSDKANEDIAPVQAKVVEYLGLSHLEKIA
jgi:hypothetical protein